VPRTLFFPVNFSFSCPQELLRIFIQPVWRNFDEGGIFIGNLAGALSPMFRVLPTPKLPTCSPPKIRTPQAHTAKKKRRRKCPKAILTCFGALPPFLHISPMFPDPTGFLRVDNPSVVPRFASQYHRRGSPPSPTTFFGHGSPFFF